MKILLISPLPMPIHGQSLAGEMAVNGLKRNNDITVIDSAFDKGFSGNKIPKIYSPKRISQIVRSLFKEFPLLWFKKYDVVYISVGITFRGFMRYVIYMLSAIVKREKYILHTHGSTFRVMYDSLPRYKQTILRYFLQKSAKTIVLGDSLVSMFENILSRDKIAVCENGVDSKIFISQAEYSEKIDKFIEKNVNLLFLSNLMIAKGIIELIDAFELLPDNFTLNIAGAIEPNDTIKSKLDDLLIKFPSRVIYHGIVKGEEKRKLLCQANIFVLPSKNEGQPLSMLEAYRCGCAVVTDGSIGGISDVFSDKINGISIKNDSKDDIARGIIECSEAFVQISKLNLERSEYFTADKFCERLETIIKEA